MLAEGKGTDHYRPGGTMEPGPIILASTRREKALVNKRTLRFG